MCEAFIKYFNFLLRSIKHNIATGEEIVVFWIKSKVDLNNSDLSKFIPYFFLKAYEAIKLLSSIHGTAIRGTASGFC
jgi:hypothetical protein